MTDFDPRRAGAEFALQRQQQAASRDPGKAATDASSRARRLLPDLIAAIQELRALPVPSPPRQIPRFQTYASLSMPLDPHDLVAKDQVSFSWGVTWFPPEPKASRWIPSSVHDARRERAGRRSSLEFSGWTVESDLMRSGRFAESSLHATYRPTGEYCNRPWARLGIPSSLAEAPTIHYSGPSVTLEQGVTEGVLRYRLEAGPRDEGHLLDLIDVGDLVEGALFTIGGHLAVQSK